MDDSELDITSRGQLVDDFKTRLMDIEKRLDCLPESTWFCIHFYFSRVPYRAKTIFTDKN